MVRRFYNLRPKQPELNKGFLRSLYNSEELSDVEKFFYCIGHSGMVDFDEDLTLESFLENLDNSYHILLSVDPDLSDPFHENHIGFTAKSSLFPPQRECINIDMPSTPENLKILTDLYLGHFGISLDDDKYY